MSATSYAEIRPPKCIVRVEADASTCLLDSLPESARRIIAGIEVVMPWSRRASGGGLHASELDERRCRLIRTEARSSAAPGRQARGSRSAGSGSRRTTTSRAPGQKLRRLKQIDRLASPRLVDEKNGKIEVRRGSRHSDLLRIAGLQALPLRRRDEVSRSRKHLQKSADGVRVLLIFSSVSTGVPSDRASRRSSTNALFDCVPSSSNCVVLVRMMSSSRST